MINEALSFLTNELDSYLKVKFRLTEDAVVLSPVTDFSGTIPVQNQNKLVITLINIKEETVLRNTASFKTIKDTSVHLNPPLYLNLFILLSANFSTYQEGLKFISAGISYFQGNSVFNGSAFPELNVAIDPLIVELDSTTYQDWSYLWGMLGGKYLPSVIYKVKMLAVQENNFSANIPLIETINSQVVKD